VTNFWRYSNINICCFRYKGKKTVTSIRDVRRTKISYLHYGEKSKTFIYNTVYAKNWLIVYDLPKNAKKCYCDDLNFNILNFNILNLRYIKF